MKDSEHIRCPLCSNDETVFWSAENGYDCVRCRKCRLLYVNPRPSSETIDTAVALGNHRLIGGQILATRARRKSGKVREAADVLREMYADVLASGRPISWLDVGAGYGEFVNTLMCVLPAHSRIDGIEPMHHKVEAAIDAGLPVREGYLESVMDKYDVISIIDVFSHIPDFASFLTKTRGVLQPGGELLVKTGNGADIGRRENFPGPLNLPDHLVFGGVPQLTRFLHDAGFDVVAIRSERVDGVIASLKNVVKRLLGKPVFLSFPYSSPARTMWIRARLRKR